MEIKKQLKVDAASFFELLSRSLRYDVETNGSKKVVNPKFEKGFKYSKKSQRGKNKVNATITLLEYQPPYAYKAKFMSEFGGSIMEYNIEDKNDGIMVTYNETTIDAEGDETKKGSGLSSLLHRKKLKTQLKQMEKSVLEGALNQTYEEMIKGDEEDTEVPSV